MNSTQDRWTVERANRWWDQQPWVCGFNFLPSSAVNFLDMWMDISFDPVTIRRELGWAKDIGFNSVRTNLHFLVWQNDRDEYLKRIDWFLETAQELGLSVMPVLFDDCGFGGEEPVYGPQPSPLPQIHNGRAVASPGRAIVMNRPNWPALKLYVRDIIAQFADDNRVLMWDLYNEPGNRMIFAGLGEHAEYDARLTEHSRDLMVACFEWAREIGASQPLTVAAWRTPVAGSQEKAFDNEIDELALSLSDIVTFHAYCDRAHALRYIDQLHELGRPMLSTEWMARTIGSRICDQLPLYHDRKVGCYNWGLVQGRTQTNLPWPHTLESQHGEIVDEHAWFHDILRADGTPYDPEETNLIMALSGVSNENGACACRA